MNHRAKLITAGLIIMNILLLFALRQIVPSSPAEFIADKTRAIELTQRAHSVIGERLLGEEFTFTTTTLAPLRAKKLTMHPEVAALAVEYLRKAGVGAGDKVAVNLSGSFPGINIATIAAIDSIGAQPLIISSVGASTWGANRADYTWLDMERELVAADVWQWQSLVSSLGGINDNGGGLMPEGKELLVEAVARNNKPLARFNTLQQAIDMRLAVYKSNNNGQLPKVLLNVGGNHVIFGKMGHKVPLKEGLSMGYDPTFSRHDGLALEFIKNNRAVIHFINIERLAAKYNISTENVGQSKVLYTQKLTIWYKLLLAVWVLGNFVILWKLRLRAKD